MPALNLSKFKYMADCLCRSYKKTDIGIFLGRIEKSFECRSLRKKLPWNWNSSITFSNSWNRHDDVIKWKHFPRYWTFVWGIHRSPVNSPHKGQRRGALVFWVSIHETGDLRRHSAYYDVTIIIFENVYKASVVLFQSHSVNVSNCGIA